MEYEIKLIKSDKQVPLSKAVNSLSPAQGDIRTEQYSEYIEPPKNPESLIELVNKSNILGQCVDALCVGIVCGYDLKNMFPELEKSNKQEIEKEKNAIAEFLESIDSSGQNSFIGFFRDVQKDIESTGNAYLEVLKTKSGKPYSFSKLDCRYMRLTEIDENESYWGKPYFDFDTNKYRYIRVPHYFRRYVLVDPYDGSKRYFKSLGNPNYLDHNTGDYYTSDEWKELPEKKKESIELANEIWHFKNYDPDSPYGLPRFAGCINDIIASILISEYNIGQIRNGFKANLVITSNIGISEKSLKMYKDYLQSGEAKLVENTGHALVLLPDMEALANSNNENQNIKIEVKELNSDKDSQYNQYDEKIIEKVISCMRLSKINVGLQSGYNRATATASQEIVDAQTFLPSRQELEFFINKRIFPLLGVKYHKFMLKSSTKQSKTEQAEILKKFEDKLTYRENRKQIEKILEDKLTDVEGEWLDKVAQLAHAEAQNSNNLA